MPRTKEASIQVISAVKPQTLKFEGQRALSFALRLFFCLRYFLIDVFDSRVDCLKELVQHSGFKARFE